jgi:hypothetical protein
LGFWCLVEIVTAVCLEDLIIVMKCGSYIKDKAENTIFKHNSQLTEILYSFVDFTNADASNLSDREFILSSIEEGIGFNALNASVRAFMVGSSFSTAIVQAAACGDVLAIERALSSPYAHLPAIVGCGYETLLERALTSDHLRGRFISTFNNWSLMSIAALGGRTACLQLLINHDGGVEYNNVDSSTPLMFAARGGQVKCLRFLLDMEADVNVKNRAGNTALMFAAISGHSDCAEILFANGAEPNVRNKDGRTALMGAASGNHVHCLLVLLENGAKVNSKDCRGKTAYDLAMKDTKLVLIESDLDRFIRNSEALFLRKSGSLSREACENFRRYVDTSKYHS